MCHIVSLALRNHCRFAHPLMSFIILARQEQLLIFININTLDLVNYDTVILYYSLSIFALNFLSIHF